MGGWASPVSSEDLDGDGDDEVLLLQTVGGYPGQSYLTAVDQGEVLWRESLPRSPDFVGAIPANLQGGPGTEVVLVGLTWSFEDGYPRAHVQAFGAQGQLWAYQQRVSWFETNGIVEADADDLDEVAVTVWESGSPVGIRILDGDGRVLRTVRSTVEETASRSAGSEAFVTDGPGSGSDEAVFIVPLLAGYYTERRSLSNGAQTAVDVKINADFPTLYQGPDYTGDGRRDALIRDYAGAPLNPSVNLGVFNGAALSSAWTTPTDYGEPFPSGDANGDGSEDVCYHEGSYWFFDEPSEPYVMVRCLAGKTGAELWKRSLEVPGEDSYASALTWSDLHGDGVIDPVLLADAWTCDEDSCEQLSFEAVAIDGRNGAEIWSTNEAAESGFVWGLLDANLDGVPGDEVLDYVHDEGAPPDARFSVHNGLTRQRSWDGVVDTGDLPAYVGSAIEADVDGDGSSEGILVATAYEETGVFCDEWDGELYCYSEYAYYPHVTAFSSRGATLWQAKL